MLLLSQTTTQNSLQAMLHLSRKKESTEVDLQGATRTIAATASKLATTEEPALISTTILLSLHRPHNTDLTNEYTEQRKQRSSPQKGQQEGRKPHNSWSSRVQHRCTQLPAQHAAQQPP